MKYFHSVGLLLAVLCTFRAGYAGQDAVACLKERVENSGLRIGYDKGAKRFVEIGVAEAVARDPSGEVLVDKLRNDLGNVAILNAKRNLMHKLTLEASGSDNVISVVDDEQFSLELKSVMRMFSQSKLMGCKVISSAESWDAAAGKYQVAVALGWSEKSAALMPRAISLDDVDVTKNDPDDLEWKRWVGSNDLRTMIGSRSFRDSNGAMRFVGLGFSNVEGLTGLKLKLAMRKASMRAIANLAYSLYADTVASEVATRYLKEFDSGDGHNLSWATFTSEIGIRCKDYAIRGHEVCGSMVVHPISGTKVYISAYGIALKQRAMK